MNLGPRPFCFLADQIQGSRPQSATMSLWLAKIDFKSRVYV